MIKAVSSLVLPALLFGTLVLHPGSACPYLMQQQGGGREDSSLIGPAPHPAVRKLQAKTIDEEDFPTSLNHQRKLQAFDIWAIIVGFFQSIFAFFFGSGGNQNGNGGNNNNTPFVGSVADALIAARQDIIGVMDAPKFVRLAFHDCVGGVCDGCVDTRIPDNFGLDGPIKDLQPIVDKYAAQLTRADVWVLAGLTAAEVSQNAGGGGNNGPPRTNELFPMQYVNRPVCNEAQGGPARQLPSAHLHTSQTLAFFANNFGFSNEETVAILGAHTLGRAVQQNSGFDGRNGWVPNRNRLDNQFYNILLDGNQVDSNFRLELQDNTGNGNFPNQFLWRRGPDRDDQFMLNADMSLVVDLGNGLLDPVTGQVSCTLNTNCPESSLKSFAVGYAQNNVKWVQDFRNALTKMTSIGCAGVCTPL